MIKNVFVHVKGKKYLGHQDDLSGLTNLKKDGQISWITFEGKRGGRNCLIQFEKGFRHIKGTFHSSKEVWLRLEDVTVCEG